MTVGIATFESCRSTAQLCYSYFYFRKQVIAELKVTTDMPVTEGVREADLNCSDL